jgi:hypothetical protein
MQVLVNFMRRDGWSVHCLAADCRTVISPWVTIGSDEALLHQLQTSGATPGQMEEVQRDMKRWGRGSTFIEVTEPGVYSCASSRLPPCRNPTPDYFRSLGGIGARIEWVGIESIHP